MAVEEAASNSITWANASALLIAAIGFLLSLRIKKADDQAEIDHNAKVAMENRLTKLEEAREAHRKEQDAHVVEHRDLWDEINRLRRADNDNDKALSAHKAVCDERNKKGVHNG